MLLSPDPLGDVEDPRQMDCELVSNSQVHLGPPQPQPMVEEQVTQCIGGVFKFFKIDMSMSLQDQRFRGGDIR